MRGEDLGEGRTPLSEGVPPISKPLPSSRNFPPPGLIYSAYQDGFPRRYADGSRWVSNPAAESFLSRERSVAKRDRLSHLFRGWGFGGRMRGRGGRYVVALEQRRSRLLAPRLGRGSLCGNDWWVRVIFGGRCRFAQDDTEGRMECSTYFFGTKYSKVKLTDTAFCFSSHRPAPHRVILSEAAHRV